MLGAQLLSTRKDTGRGNKCSIHQLGGSQVVRSGAIRGQRCAASVNGEGLQAKTALTGIHIRGSASCESGAVQNRQGTTGQLETARGSVIAGVQAGTAECLSLIHAETGKGRCREWTETVRVGKR